MTNTISFYDSEDDCDVAAEYATVKDEGYEEAEQAKVFQSLETMNLIPKFKEAIF